MMGPEDGEVVDSRRERWRPEDVSGDRSNDRQRGDGERGWHEWSTHRREPERGRESDRLMCTVCGKSFSGAKVLATHCKVVHKLAGVPGGGRSGGGAWDATPAKTGAASVDMAGWQTLQDPASGAYFYYHAPSQQSSWAWSSESTAAAPQTLQLHQLGKVLGEQASLLLTFIISLPATLPPSLNLHPRPTRSSRPPYLDGRRRCGRPH